MIYRYFFFGLNMRIILASKSQFRKHALEVLGLSYETVPSNFDESTIRNKNPNKLAQMLSEAKSKKIGENHSNSIIIAADLFIVHKQKIYGKPKDENEAKEMLKALSGHSFDIITGLAVYNSQSKKMLSTSESCQVKFRNLSDFEIDDYISRYPVIKCAAAFEADGLLRCAEYIQGNYNFRTAIPVNKLILFLRKNGIKV